MVFMPCKCTTVRTLGVDGSAPWIVGSIGRKCLPGRSFSHLTAIGRPRRASKVGAGYWPLYPHKVVAGRSRCSFCMNALAVMS